MEEYINIMIKNFKSPNLNGPRFREKRLSFLNKTFSKKKSCIDILGKLITLKGVC